MVHHGCGLAEYPVKIRADAIVATLIKRVAETTPRKGFLLGSQLLGRALGECRGVIVGQILAFEKLRYLSIAELCIGIKGCYTKPDVGEKSARASNPPNTPT